MGTTVRVPGPMQALVGGERELDVDGGTVGDVLARIEADHPGVLERLIGTDGTVHRFVNIFVGDHEIRRLDGLATPVGDGVTVSIVPAVAGG